MWTIESELDPQSCTCGHLQNDFKAVMCNQHFLKIVLKIAASALPCLGYGTFQMQIRFF